MRSILAAAACLAILACGSSEPESPLILDGKPDQAIGLRSLTPSQNEELRGAIVSGGQECTSLDTVYLNDVDPNGSSESWAVRCLEGSYIVRISAQTSVPTVYRCRDRSFDDIPCFQGYANAPSRRSRPPGELNPDLGKLLEPMTSKDGKVQ